MKFAAYILPLLLFTVAIPAQATHDQTNHGQAVDTPQDDVQSIIHQGIEHLQTFIQSGSPNNPEQVKNFLQKEIAPYFDFQAMARMVIGPMEHHLNDEQKTNAQAFIQQQFLVSFARNLMGYRGGHGQLMNITGDERNGQLQAWVYIYRYQAVPTVVELRLARGPQGWKIYDVAANGVSAVSHFRNYFHATIQRSGIQILNSVPSS